MSKGVAGVSVGILVVALLGAAAKERHRVEDPDQMAVAARRFVDGLRPELRDRAVLPFDSANRKDWHFVPRERQGLAIGAMTPLERRAAHELLRSALSPHGYLKVGSIIELEVALRELAEAAGRRADHRDPERYYFTIFGSPGSDEPWGWRVEGHHLSLNFSSVTDELIATTPAFMGANPAEVQSGRRAGWRVLAAEEDLARELLAALDDGQRSEAIMSDRAPRDIMMGPGRTADRLGEPVGLAGSKMTRAQRAMLVRLIREYVLNLEADLALAQLERITQAGIGDVRFAWAGSTVRGEPHYYRVRGPTFVIEYDNTQNGANHVHTVWRDLENDFGGDLLRRHYRERHSP